MTRSRRALLAGAVITAAVAGCGARTSGGAAPAPTPATPRVVADGLANPRQLSFGPDGSLYIAEAGSGGHARCTKDPSTGQPICVGSSGAIARLRGGVLTRVVSGLPSVAGASGQDASGPADVIATRRGLELVSQDTRINRSGANQFAGSGRLLGRLLAAPQAGRLRSEADLAAFEAAANPDRGAGAAAGRAIESDPYGLVAYRGGYAVADAAANDVLWVTRSGAVGVLAVLPVQYQTVPGEAAGTTAKPVAAQSVPTSVAVGPDGALYVGELTGFPFAAGSARVWRIVPGQPPAVYAGGFTNISAITFDRRGRLLVLEINRAGLRDQQAPGELIRLEAGSRRTVLASAGLSSPTGVAVAPDGSIYVANHGASPATGAGAHGQIVRLAAG